MNPPTTTDVWSLVAVAVLTAIAAFLAAAETGLTRMSRARAMHLREEQRGGSAQLLALVEQPARCSTWFCCWCWWSSSSPPPCSPR